MSSEMKFSRFLAALLLVVSAGHARAATFDVTITGEITDIFNAPASFLSAAPFAVGDRLTATTTFEASPTAVPASSGTLYRDTLVAISGSIGSYNFKKATRPDPLRPIHVNTTQVRGADNPALSGDLVQSSHSVAGDLIDGFVLQTLNYVLFNADETAFADDGFGPDLFSQILIDSLTDPGDRADAIFNFSRPGAVSVQVHADLRAPVPVPLPPALPLMAVAFGVLLLLRRRV